MHKGNKGFGGSSLPLRLQVGDIPLTCSRPASSPRCHCCSPTAALTQKGNRLGCSKFSHMEKRQYWCIAQPYTRGCSLIVAQPGAGRRRAGCGGACPHSQTVSDGGRRWGTPAGLPRSGFGRRNNENVAVPAGHRPRLELELSPGFWWSSLQLRPTAGAAVLSPVPLLPCCNHPLGLQPP